MLCMDACQPINAQHHNSRPDQLANPAVLFFTVEVFSPLISPNTSFSFSSQVKSIAFCAKRGKHRNHIHSFLFSNVKIYRQFPPMNEDFWKMKTCKRFSRIESEHDTHETSAMDLEDIWSEVPIR